MWERSVIVWIHRCLFYYAFAYMIFSFLLMDYYRNIPSTIIFIISLVLGFLTTLYLLRFLDDYWKKRNAYAAKNQR